MGILARLLGRGTFRGDSGRATWDVARDDARQVRQVVIDAGSPPWREPELGTLFLKRHRRLTEEHWVAGFFARPVTLDFGRPDATKGARPRAPGPFLLVRANGHVEALRECPLRIAVGFYRMPSGGLLGVFVEGDSLDLRRASATGHAVFESIYGLDSEHQLDLCRAALAQPTLHMCFATAATGAMNVDLTESDLDVTRPPECQFDRLVDLPEACRQKLTEELSDLVAYHTSLPAHRRDYDSSLQQLSAAFPPSETPILGRR